MAKTIRKTRNQKRVVKKNKKDPTLRKLHPRQIEDPAMRERWDVKKTAKQNISSMNVKEMYYNRLPEKIPKRAKNIPKVNEEEAPICEKLSQKHGDKYDAMHRDIKINVFQWTAQQCKKKVAAWQEGRTRSAAAEILSGHGEDIRKPIFGAARARNVFGH
eukprot:TRINITY_DN33438_c0_g1_i1.p1 TRINITY_DN33438_c0_g1~~TRINITY_DN33438_c0_g1_i1.p1  ORF type:complete len:160 (-),score=54.28 TRINITY_DN33438_c0_g1_i1:70-549(-)